MRQFVGIGAVWTALVVALWRGLSELLERRRELAGAGVLAHRVAARRAGRIELALVEAGLCARSLEAVHASVHVGAVRASDLDDVGLLEAAMRRAARDRMEVAADGVHSTVPANEPVVADVLRWWIVPVGALAAALTSVPLVRPLEPAAPWLALAGAAMACAAWFAARRR